MLTSTILRSLVRCCYTVLSILTPVITAIHYPWDKFVETSRPVCKTKECVDIAHDLLYSIKSIANPCEDFYEHACGDWKKHRDLEPYEGYVNLEYILQHEAYAKILSKLDEPTKSNEDSEIVKAKLLHKACMALPYLEKTDEAVLRKHMGKYGFWSVPSEKKDIVNTWAKIHNHYLSITGDSAFFEFGVHMPEDDKKPHLKIQRISSPFGALHHVYHWETEQKLHYFSFLKEVFRLVTASEKTTVELMQDDLRDVFNFRLILQRLLLSKENPLASKRMQIDEISNFYFDKACLKNSIATIDWLEMLRSLYKESRTSLSTAEHINEKTMVDVFNKDYLAGLCHILSRTRQRTIVNHIHLYFMERHLTLTKNLKNLLAFAITRGLVSTGRIRYKQKHWYSCIQSNSMQGALGRLYYNNFVPQSAIQEAKVIIENLKEIIKMQVDDAKWLKDTTKRGTAEKVNEMKVVIGYPNENDPTIPTKIFEKMLSRSATATSFYDGDENIMFISSFYFQPPVYDRNLPFSFIYATLGSLIGHEMYHIFDDEAIHSGVLSPIWEKKSTKHHKQKLECFVNYYFKQPVRELEYLKFKKPQLKSRTTRDEDVADVMGLKTAFNAYKKLVWDGSGECPTLPRFDKVPCDRLFFLSYARMFCSIVPEEVLIRRLQVGRTSPNRLRVNVPISTMKEFARAFQCETGTPMNPMDKCDLWT